MLVTFQFPLSDARPFDPDPELRLGLPDWSNLATAINPQFVHRFGRAVERRSQPDLAWPDEQKFCRAHRALRFPNLAAHPAGAPGKELHPQCAFRRLFCDGATVARVEVGIVHSRSAPPLTGLATHEILAVLVSLCEMPAQVPAENALSRPAPLITRGPALATLFTRATLGTAILAKLPRAAQLVEAGVPLAVVELGPLEAETTLDPQGFTPVPTAKTCGAEVLFGRVRSHSGIIPVWLLRRGTATNDQLRSLRLCLLRLHAEQECLDLILKQLRRNRLLNPSTESSVDALDKYFNERTRLINQREWSGVGQSAILAAVEAATLVTPPGTKANFAARYDGARKNVWKKVDEYQQRRLSARLVPVINVAPGGTYMENHVSVSGSGNIVNIAKYMENVTNTVQGNLKSSDASTQVKDLISQLTAQITAIADKADPKVTKTMGADLTTLSNEIAQDEPRRPWYELSLKGLKDAAMAVGDIAKPILQTVGLLTPLLLP